MRRSATDAEDPASSHSSSPPPRSTQDSGIGDVLRRVIEAGAKNLKGEPMRQLLAEMRLPKDALLHLLSQALLTQLEETKESVYRSVSRELQEVLERTNLSDEIAGALSQLSVEVTMQVKFNPKSPSESARSSAANFSSDSAPPGAEPQSSSSQIPTPPEKKSP